jgi:hypothetical protein
MLLCLSRLIRDLRSRYTIVMFAPPLLNATPAAVAVVDHSPPNLNTTPPM